MKKLSKTKKAVLMLIMLLSLSTAFAGDGTNPISDFTRRFWGEECGDSFAGYKCCNYVFWIQTSCSYYY
jgi:hypothetical protein